MAAVEHDVKLDAAIKHLTASIARLEKDLSSAKAIKRALENWEISPELLDALATSGWMLSIDECITPEA